MNRGFNYQKALEVMHKDELLDVELPDSGTPTVNVNHVPIGGRVTRDVERRGSRTTDKDNRERQ